MPETVTEPTPVQNFANQSLKQRDLLKCISCRRGVAHNGTITFFRLRLSQFVLNTPAIQRQHGLEQMVPGLAAVLGPDEDMALPIGEGVEVNLCNECAFEDCVAFVYERSIAD